MLTVLVLAYGVALGFSLSPLRAPDPTPASGVPMSLIAVLAGGAILAVVVMVAGWRIVLPVPPIHDGSTILATPALLAYLARFPKVAPTDPAAVRRLLSGHVREVEGGLLVSRCTGGHTETIGCWAFYPDPKAPVPDAFDWDPVVAR
jgi:hypothetical protein